MTPIGADPGHATQSRRGPGLTAAPHEPWPGESDQLGPLVKRLPASSWAHPGASHYPIQRAHPHSARAWLPAVVALLAIALLSLVSHGLAPAAAGQTPPARNHYSIRVDLNIEATYLTAVETVSFTNVTSDTLKSIVFNVPAAYFGGFSLADVTIGNVPVHGVMDKQSLEFVLPRPLAPGDTTTIVLHFRLEIPPSDGRYGAGMGVIALADWYPMLAVYQEGWQRTPYNDIGDPFFTEVADYDVFVASSSPVLVVASGERVSQSGKSWHFAAHSARDFALAASSRYQLLEGASGGITVTVAALPEHVAGASLVLSVTLQAISEYTTQVGGYPYHTFSVAETVAQRNVHTAQEHAGLIFLRSDMVEANGLLLEMLTAHEVAHQWFFGVVGNDQTREPWLDEGLVTAMALDYFRQRDAEAYKGLWDGWGNYTAPGYLNRSIYDFKTGTAYFDEIYRRGATFIRDLQDLMGPAAYRGALRAYYASHTSGVATAADFLLQMRAASPRDPLALYRRAFDYAYLAAPDPVVTLTVPGSVVIGLPSPLTATADQSKARLTAAIDGITTTISATGTVSIPSSLSPGDHTLSVVALGPGVGLARKDAVFALVQPLPTPTPEPLPTVTRAAPAPTPAPPLPPTGPSDRDIVLAFLGWLGMAAVFSFGAAAMSESSAT